MPKTLVKPSTIELKQPSGAVLKQITAFRSQSLMNSNLIQPIFFPKVKGITHWEELECVGYNPDTSQIEAIVHVKRSSGYSGNLCSLGSPEFIRFFIDYKDGKGFQDLGLSSFRAHDISEAPAGPQHPIAYMAIKELDVSGKKKFCNNEVIVTIRAILSWNQIPSTNPNQVPNYGNMLDAEAVLKPFNFVFPGGPIVIQPNNPILANFSEFNKIQNVTEFDAASFIKINLEKKVSPGRAMTQLLTIANESNNKSLSAQLEKLNLEELGINIDDFTLELGSKDFNVGYEEIVSVGMNTAQDTLGAVIDIKRPVGYGGNLCKKGSLEYVSFFADFNNNGVFEKYLGTTFVRVHDISTIPAEGLKYAVFLKTDLSKYLKKCADPQIIRIRALLSWSTPPNPSNPEQQVAWGNRMDRLVQLRPKTTNQTSLIYSVGNVSLDDISPVTNLAYPGNASRGNNRPWGGAITLKGGIDNSGLPGTTKYRVEYSQNGVDFSPVTLKQGITTINFSNPLNPYTYHLLEDPNGWFPYLANHNPANLTVIQNQVLATWPSHLNEGKYYLRVSYTKLNPIVNPTSIEHSAMVAIKLDNRRFRVDNTPNNTLDINFDIDMTIDGGVCKTYEQGHQMTGKAKVRDQYFGGYDLNIQPNSQIINSTGLINYDAGAVLDNANINEFGPTSDDFNVDTSKLNKCGYTLRLRGYERTIINNSHLFPHGDKYIGFAIK